MKIFLLLFSVLSLILISITNVSAKTGRQVYKQHCEACHSFGPGPIKGKKASWIKAIKATPTTISADLSERNNLINSLTKVSIKGVPTKGMPAKGGCTECTEAELQAAIDYMLPKKLNK